MFLELAKPCLFENIIFTHKICTTRALASIFIISVAPVTERKIHYKSLAYFRKQYLLYLNWPNTTCSPRHLQKFDDLTCIVLHAGINIRATFSSNEIKQAFHVVTNMSAQRSNMVFVKCESL